MSAQIGRYQIIRLLGSGGMGQVYEAELIGLGTFRKRVALKLLSSKARLDQVVREATLGGLLRHPNLVDTYEFGQDGDVSYIVMELIRGPTLLQLLRGRVRLPPRVAAQIGAQVATGLAHAHGTGTGLVHRDLKPGNVLISRYGIVKLADFGIAMPTTEGNTVAMGTPGYMSPEQAAGREVDGRADLWSLGALLYSMVMGSHVVPRESGIRAASIIRAMEDRDIESEVESRAPGLGSIVARCLEVDPDARPQRAGEVRRALRAAAQDLPGYSLGALLADAVDDLALSQLFTDDTLGSLTADPDTTESEPMAPDSEAPTTLLPAGNLGPEPDRFVGRDAEVETLQQTMGGDPRLVTVRGRGGIGKSRLANHVAREIRAAYAGGSWRLDVTRCQTADDLDRETLRVVLGPDADGVEGPLEACPQVPTHMLLLLDDCDGALSFLPDRVATWLAEMPTITVLATSRERLQVAGEHVVDLGPLPAEHAVALFQERRAAEQEAPGEAVEELVGLMCGVPLAIELAAARARLMSPDRLAQTARSDRFRLLRSARRGQPPRLRSLHDNIALTWDRLTPHEQRAAKLLAALPSRFDAEQAEQAVDLSDDPSAPWVFDLLEGLVERAFLRNLGDGQFELDDDLRAFAATQQPAPEP